jgi:hypothetical protein
MCDCANLRPVQHLSDQSVDIPKFSSGGSRTILLIVHHLCADAFIGEDLEQQRVFDPAINDMNLVHTGVKCIKR